MLSKYVLLLLPALVISIPIIGCAQDETDPPQPPNLDSPVVSPDGNKIAFVSDATGTRRLWLANRDGTDPRELATTGNSDQVEPDWTSDGRRLVFAATAGSADFNIWIVNIDGTGATQLTTLGANRQPRVSPDGTRIVFTSTRTGKRELWYMALDGSSQKAIGLQSVTVNDPTWSPNGQSVAYVGCTPPPNGGGLFDSPCNLFSIALDASVTTRVTSGAAQDWKPDWGTMGIVFSSIRGGRQGLWIVNPDGTNLHQITDSPGALDSSPRWDRQTGEVLLVHGASIWSFNTTTQVTKELIAADTTPPVIAGMPTNCSLWPPNRKMHVVATVSASDALSGIDTFTVTANSNEPMDEKEPDILITKETSGGSVIQLRADRLGNGKGRVYTLVGTAKDRAGNVATVSALCTVPHDQSN